MEDANIDEETVNNIEADETSMTVNETFLNPSQEESELFKCDKCDFQADFLSTIQNHTADDHPMYCCRCKQEFVSKTQCRKHKQKIHNIKPFQ